ncbi:hypothetical protein [Leifsonia sp. C5G2]|uniref:hypothetical protein n=1 Tax=Leifsonia sp. C5G2 TaxID=2735269 RepID=UPI00201C0BD3|nr:hypothetical protein [Leifsonia sp. C5G2]
MFGVQMVGFGVDADRLLEGSKALKRSSAGSRPSGDQGDGFGSSVARGALARFEGYWVAGQSAVDESVVGLSGVLEQVAAAYERRDADDASRFRVDGGELVGF